AELEMASGIGVGYRACGTLAVAADRGDLAVLEKLCRFHHSLGLPSELVGPSDCRRLEPLLAPGISGGLLAPGDHQVDNRLLIEALGAACQRSGVRLVAARVEQLSRRGARAVGVQLGDGTTLAGGQVLLAAGCWSGQIGGLAPHASPPVRPVKGVILRLNGPATAPVLSRNLKGLVKGSSVYLVPRLDGTVVLGATVEEQGFDTRVKVGSVADLLEDARAVLRAVDDLELVETHAGLRPGSPDNAPMLGRPSGVEGLVIATGHYRNGILLAPVTADSIAEVLAGGESPALIAPFSPRRWEPAGWEPAGWELAQ
ncbi:MAG: FAD-dependent oxidoreductase, partial [Acidimicrobiales bacterium]